MRQTPTRNEMRFDRAKLFRLSFDHDFTNPLTAMIYVSRVFHLSFLKARRMTSVSPASAAFLVWALTLASCQPAATDLNMPQPPQNPLVVPTGFPQPSVPADNPITPEKVELGRDLFYTNELSSNNQLSCAGCHSLAASFSDPGKAVSMGVFNERGSRNAPPLMNLAYDTVFFWDGRATSLEQQAVGPILNPVELGNDSLTVVATLNKDPFYRELFAKAFPDGSITITHIAQAIATFERTLISGSSAYDRFALGDSSALSASAQRGLTLFKSNSVNCIACHSGVNFTDNAYHSTGLDFEYADIGREDVTQNQNDNGKFRTPSLRNIALTEPYMHDGRFTNLQQVLDHYNSGGMHNTTQDTLVHKLNLSQSQEDDLIAFLQSLTDNNFVARKDFANPFH
jgi:cytochrome c peroxidase